ncbi:MAG: glycerol-3-phosphate 1-O-acyltransferase PlsY [Dehalococcoidia bacterium]|nr:glycerol-3-phosphate 1-O-acyltransferase PlsY [Dehalococcoidia bacterium]
MLLRLLLITSIGYLLGSIPFGLILGRIKANMDIRNYGSGRTGSTNVLRTMGRRAFVTVAILDVLKGTAAVLLGRLIFGGGYLAVGLYHLEQPGAVSIAAIAAVAGHIWPVFSRFKGGRGVGTFIGTMFAICPAAALFGGEILIIVAGLSGFASLGSLSGIAGICALLIPLTFLYGSPLEYLLYAMAAAVLITIVHHDNIIRLFNGRERKLNQKAEAHSGSPA